MKKKHVGKVLGACRGGGVGVHGGGLGAGGGRWRVASG